jgi:hypothetical protein
VLDCRRFWIFFKLEKFSRFTYLFSNYITVIVTVTETAVYITVTGTAAVLAVTGTAAVVFPF